MLEFRFCKSRRQIAHPRFLGSVLVAALATIAFPQAVLGQDAGTISLTKIVSPDPAGIGNTKSFKVTVTCTTTNSTDFYTVIIHGNTSLIPTHPVRLRSHCQIIEALPLPFTYGRQNCVWLPPTFSPPLPVTVNGMNTHVTVTNSYKCSGIQNQTDQHVPEGN